MLSGLCMSESDFGRDILSLMRKDGFLAHRRQSSRGWDALDEGRLLVVCTCVRELGHSPLVPLGISLLMETDEAGARRDNELK